MKVENGYLILPQNFRNKKITATTFYGLTGGNKFKPKGDYLLSSLGLLVEKIDPFYMKRGEIAEIVVNKWLKSRGYETKTWNKFEIKFDNFQNNEYFGGMIDIAITSPIRCLIECKSKNIKDKEKIKKFPNKEQEYQALFYGYLSKCENIKIIYVFFTDEQEEFIRQGIDIETDFNNYEFYEKDLVLNKEDLISKLNQSLEYKLKCLNENKIPLNDISDKALKLLNLERK